jgi:hypothetical protein
MTIGNRLLNKLVSKAEILETKDRNILSLGFHQSMNG